MNWFALAQGVGTGINLLSNIFNRPKPFGETAYGRRLKQLSEQGIYSPTAKSNILGGVGKETGNIASQAKAGYKGRLISQGMGGSIAGQRGLADIDVQRMGQMGKVAKDIETQNELSKAQYGLQYAQAATDYGQQLRDYDRNTVMGLVQGATGALGTYEKGQQYEKEMKLKEKQITGDIANQRKYYDYLKTRYGQPQTPNIEVPDFSKMNSDQINKWLFSGDPNLYEYRLKILARYIPD